MTKTKNEFSPEVRAVAIRMVLDSQPSIHHAALPFHL